MFFVAFRGLEWWLLVKVIDWNSDWVLAIRTKEDQFKVQREIHFIAFVSTIRRLRDPEYHSKAKCSFLPACDLRFCFQSWSKQSNLLYVALFEPGRFSHHSIGSHTTNRTGFINFQLFLNCFSKIFPHKWINCTPSPERIYLHRFKRSVEHFPIKWLIYDELVHRCVYCNQKYGTAKKGQVFCSVMPIEYMMRI